MSRLNKINETQSNPFDDFPYLSFGMDVNNSTTSDNATGDSTDIKNNTNANTNGNTNSDTNTNKSSKHDSLIKLPELKSELLLLFETFENRQKKFTHLPSVEKSFRSLNGEYLINISSCDFFVEDAMSRDVSLQKNARHWSIRIISFRSNDTYYTECCEYFWKPFTGLFLSGIDIIKKQNSILVKFIGGDTLELDKINNLTMVEIKDYEASIFVE